MPEDAGAFGVAAPSVDDFDALLPQTQCTRCGYPDCRHYAQALFEGRADINRCPPGGTPGIQALARLSGRPARALDPACGTEGPRRLARIDEDACIGCTLCLPACPVDAIFGARKAMHVVLVAECTGCELCLPVCPIDCIEMVGGADPSVQAAAEWTPHQANTARQRYRRHLDRQARDLERAAARRLEKAEHKLAHLEAVTKPAPAPEVERKRATIEAALARARSRRSPP